MDTPLSLNGAQQRSCSRCGAGLARDNHSVLCRPCSRGQDRVPQLCAADWRTEQMREALRSRNIGIVLHAWRHHHAHGPHPIPQARLARWLGITQGQLSRIENGRNKVRDLDKLMRYTRTLGIPAEMLWFDIDEPAPAPTPTPGPLRLRDGLTLAPPAAEPLLIDSLRTTLQEYVRTDNVAGPQPLLMVVGQQLRFVERLENASRGRTQTQLRLLRARFAEFLGWLHQDAGNLRAALTWTAAAAELTRETADSRLLSYIRMRQSSLAADVGDPRNTIALAQTSLRTPTDLTARQRAMALRQIAHGHARLGQLTDTMRALDQAAHQAASPDDDELAGYCTPEYIAMEAAACLIELDRPEQAIATLEPQLPQWRPENRRDFGRGLTLLAIALARSGQPDDAVEVAQHALAIIAETRSTRTEQQLYRVIRELHTHGAAHQGAQLRIAVRHTIG
ncbi:helix-turn-helix domain-containing protein [Nocardia pseudobrasiliensis]|uniref:HTH cro/C1-type domain-containing protein n=1 Tax=Nocardia pseudobrasiliensis TaxID=45979 RepID=A0A370HKV9_9NOCA|nr:helix-turn-helix transcriptional regulator [Nocardia pseudobrasiliensis]RDI58980.1 hypothetical protein DFR76_12215 [Nocardia pseudobrasiliensis]